MRYDARQEIENIKLKLGNIQITLDDLVQNHLPHIQRELERMSGRPTWVVVAIITALFSLVSLFLSIILRR